MYYSAPYIPDILLKLDPISRHLLEQLEECIQTSHGFEHTSAKSQAEKGLVSKNLFNYLIRPGDVLVNSVGPLTQAYLALDWAKEVPQPEEGRPEDYNQWDEFTRVKGRKRGTNANDTRNLVHYQWTVPVWSWRFDGHFNKIHQDLVLDMKASYAAEILPITELSMFPLRYASPNLHETLERRGKAFWQLRYRKFVSYQQNEEDGELSNARYFQRFI
jgi:hypothetical protein